MRVPWINSYTVGSPLIILVRDQMPLPCELRKYCLSWSGDLALYFLSVDRLRHCSPKPGKEGLRDIGAVLGLANNEVEVRILFVDRVDKSLDHSLVAPRGTREHTLELTSSPDGCGYGSEGVVWLWRVFDLIYPATRKSERADLVDALERGTENPGAVDQLVGVIGSVVSLEK